MSKQSALDLDVLRGAIKDFAANYGRGAHAYLLKRTGVHNTRRMVEREITPTLDTWTKLHASMPEDFPPPTQQGEQVKISQHARGGATLHTSSGNTEAYADDKILTTLDKELVELLMSYGSIAFKERLKEKLLQLKSLTDSE